MPFEPQRIKYKELTIRAPEMQKEYDKNHKQMQKHCPQEELISAQFISDWGGPGTGCAPDPTPVMHSGAGVYCGVVGNRPPATGGGGAGLGGGAKLFSSTRLGRVAERRHPVVAHMQSCDGVVWQCGYGGVRVCRIARSMPRSKTFVFALFVLPVEE